MTRRIFDLCAGSGAWSQPYVDAGYEVVRLDILNGDDVRLQKAPMLPVHGVLAAPPCTVFAQSGNRHQRFTDEVRDGLSVVDACLRFIYACQPAWWALENPVGKLVHYLGEPAMRFDPAEFGDGYTKRTCLWGAFTLPTRTHKVTQADIEGGRRRHNGTRKVRSITPPGFAKAFFDANP